MQRLAISLCVLLFAACRSSQDLAIRTNPLQPTPETVEISFNELEGSPVDMAVLRRSPFERITFDVGKEKASYTVAALELDDDGVLFQPGQIDDVTKRIRSDARGRGAVIVVFVHGWKHNATPCDDNLSCFRTVLRKLAEDEHKEGGGRLVAGVYVGWRGLSSCREPAKEVSFYGRKMAAERVGAAQAREILQNLRDLHEELKTAYPGIKSRLVTVGHSFGAALVHEAVLPDMQQDLLFARRKAVEAHTKQLDLLFGYGDLVVLVNPAFEAERFDSLPRQVRLLQTDGYSFHDKQKPVYVVVSSVADKPTHWAFPAGQFFSLVLQPLKVIRGPAYWARYLITAGNYPRYRTHTATQIDPVSSGTSTATDTDNCFDAGIPSQYPACSCNQATFGAMTQAIAAGATAVSSDSQEVYGNVLLTPHEGWPANDPFWVVKAKPNVVASHNDIFNPTFVSFLHSLVTRADQGY